MLLFREKAFQPFIWLGINGKNFVRGKNLVFFFATNIDKWVVPIRIHDIDTLVSGNKDFNPSFLLGVKFILKIGRTLFMARI